jgi:hypothetical protein
MTLSDGNSVTEFIILDKNTYMRAGGAWSVSPMDAGTMISGLLSSVSQDVIDGIKDVKLAGPDSVNGVPSFVYTYTTSIDLGGSQITSNIKLWVGVANGLPLKQEVDGEFAGVKSHTVQLVEYDKTIKIEAPIK